MNRIPSAFSPLHRVSRMLRPGPALALLVLLVPAVAEAEGTKELEGLEAYAASAMDAWQVPGLAAGVVRDDALVLARGFGVREAGKPGPVDGHTLFAVASNTKAFTAALLGTLVDEGKLRWDDPVTDHLPWFRLYDPWVTREITVRDLLTHRSGLPTFGGDHLWIGGSLDGEAILRRIRHLAPTASFRTRFQYQNIMYLAAGRVAGAAAGRSWHDLLRERIFRPLGMNESNSSIRALEGLTNVARPHELRGGRPVPAAFDDVDSTAPAGAINASVTDMSKWMRLNLGDGVFEGRRVLSREVIREMQSMQIPLELSAFDREVLGTRFAGYGLGWRISDYRGWKLVSHGGGLTGMTSFQALLPEKKLGVIVVTNLAPHGLARALAFWILDRLLGAPPKDWSAAYLEERARKRAKTAARERALEARRVPGTRPSHKLADYTGTYRNDLSGTAEVRLEDGGLVFAYNPRHTGDLEHWHYDTFRVTWRQPIYDMPARSFLTFHLDESGRIEALTVTFYHPNRFERARTGEDRRE